MSIYFGGSNTDWAKDCLHWRGKILRGPGCHWCFDWDGLPVNAFTLEYECCHGHKTLIGAICNFFWRHWYDWRVRVYNRRHRRV